MDHPGNLFVVAAPSGSGKSTLVNALLEVDAGVAPSISHTTRAPRGQEKDGREYFFISNEAFDVKIAAGDFLEWALVHGNRYGTSRQAIEARIAAGGDVVLEMTGRARCRSRSCFRTPSWCSCCRPAGKSCAPA